MKISLVFLICLFATITLHAKDITGIWRTIDDKSSLVLAQVKIEKHNNIYIGTIIEQFPFPGQPLIEYCQKCPQPYTDKAIKGLQIISGLRDDPQDPDNYINGKVLDPLTGKIYSMKAKISTDGRKLRIRGYIGTSMLGRNQTWLRKD